MADTKNITKKDSSHEKKFTRIDGIPKKVFIPTRKTEYLFSITFVLMILISLFSFPIGQFLSADIEIIESTTLNIGWPMHFFEISYAQPEKNPVKFWGLLVDIFLALLISYLLDVLINTVVYHTRRLYGDELKKENREEVMKQAKKAYHHYKRQGLKDEHIKEMFRKNGWKERDIEEIFVKQEIKT